MPNTLNMGRSRFIKISIVGLLLMIGIQFIPLDLTNPPEKTSVPWDSPRTETLFRRACADCHSHQTIWPWYSHVAPVSWYTLNHVKEAREAMNVSIPDHAEPDEIAHQIRKEKMPLLNYKLLHPESRLTDEEKKDLIEGMKKTLGSSTE
ncbi:MAG: heme-binding domain-containing protein [Verrucomicrobiota bacterium]